MLEGRIVGLELTNVDLKLKVSVEVDRDRLGDTFKLGKKILLLDEQGFAAPSKLVDRGSQYLLVPSSMRVKGERLALAKKAELTLPERPYFVFKCDG